MKLRAPAIPLITVDPYFSVWAVNEKLNYETTKHWTGSDMTLFGTITTDGEEMSFLGYNRDYKKMKQTEMDIDALSTRYTFENGKIRLFVKFMTPLLLDDYDLMSRPVSYMIVKYESIDGKAHDVKLSISVSDEICLNHGKESPVVAENFDTDNVHGMRMGNSVQKPLEKAADNLRIDWGYFYLGIDSETIEREYSQVPYWKPSKVIVKAKLDADTEKKVLFAYDDNKSICYFGNHLTSYWNKDGESILSVMDKAITDFTEINARCDAFSDCLVAEAYIAGGEKYADLLSLAYRQVVAAHKLAVDENGELLFVSKECFSGGFASTVDVSYPSIPLFLRYNPELVKAMMRPVYRFAASEAWKYDFAPHDLGMYPQLNGQLYGYDKKTGDFREISQMPVEECGNMIIMEAAVAIAEENADFAKSHIEVLEGWCHYLFEHGDDPGNQLCTDDFAGHLAHNCNLSLKAIMGIMGMSIIYRLLGETKKSTEYKNKARKMANSWCERAKNSDGSYKLAFDIENSYSMKYNMVWDKLWGSGLFSREVIDAEIKSNLTKFNEYGMPLDSRTEYTKSDWAVWTATLSNSLSDFKKFINPIWKAYNEMSTRVPMTDWYDTVSGLLVEFVNRTVQGGLYIKMLDKTGIMKKYKKIK